MKLLFLLLSLSCYSALADDIYLKSGFIYKNVQIIMQTDDGFTIYNTPNGQSRIKTNGILQIRRAPFDPNMKSETVVFDADAYSDSVSNANRLMASGGIIVTRPNLKLLPLSAVAFALAFDYLDRAWSLPDDDANHGDKVRGTTLGIVFLAAGVVNTIISLETVEVRAQGFSLSVAYKF